ncbi:hypothetical protein B0T26DRAFT_732758 [Lasiosphaeria miniovina]|uniref:Secreted protein n=1 Tax=Lasiosphaeria miniovina TaxID=1954250 RepID=A0AA39ZU67_9PEZI|nr:uncharacterized protein B0T26DRAFT_732758 [Lasiosphaeria miniovina]KAK0703801.1 hypothetical protein B0T26DRAFT_732758 [Lasiosphaeria miniovina]
MAMLFWRGIWSFACAGPQDDFSGPRSGGVGESVRGELLCCLCSETCREPEQGNIPCRHTAAESQTDRMTDRQTDGHPFSARCSSNDCNVGIGRFDGSWPCLGIFLPTYSVLTECCCRMGWTSSKVCVLPGLALVGLAWSGSGGIDGNGLSGVWFLEATGEWTARQKRKGFCSC